MKILIHKITFILGFLILVLGCGVKESYEFPIDILSDNQYSKFDRYFFNHLIWKTKLNEREQKSILKTIKSTPNNYQHIELGLNIMLPALVHRLAINSDIDSSLHWENYYDYTNENKILSDEEFDYFLYSDIRPEELRMNVRIPHAHYESRSDVLVNVLVIRNSKSLRNGNSQYVELPDSILTSNQKQLLAYSRLPNDQAVEKLIDELSTYDGQAGKNVSDLMMTLQTYDSGSTKRLLKIFRDTNEIKKITHDGKTFLLLSLGRKIYTDLPVKEQLEFVDMLNREEIYDGLLCEQKLIITSISQTVRGEELEKYWNRVGTSYRDIEAQKKDDEQVRKYLEEEKEKRDKRNAEVMKKKK